jgi:hypothetical protein
MQVMKDLNGGWLGFSPDDESVPLDVRQSALDRRARKPAATITIAIYSDEPGDLDGGFEVDPDGPFGGVERSNSERVAAFHRISEIVRDEATRWVDSYTARRH